MILVTLRTGFRCICRSIICWPILNSAKILKLKHGKKARHNQHKDTKTAYLSYRVIDDRIAPIDFDYF
ncbi:hypothetical protein A1L58_06595 [Shewanella baltica]|nr:hypothetical protein A1L58_06595 [Shewanella baltica]